MADIINIRTKPNPKKFLEIVEIRKNVGFASDANPILVKEEVESRNDAISKHAIRKNGLGGKNYRSFFHICNHGLEGGNKPCSFELIEEKLDERAISR